MKFLVDETPNFYDECPFSKEVWDDGRWRGFCTLVNEPCNLYENRYHRHECYGLKENGVDDETEIQNSNVTFEKVMEEIQTQVIEFPDTHQKFIFTRKIEMDGDSIKICGWEYKGVKDED